MMYAMLAVLMYVALSNLKGGRWKGKSIRSHQLCHAQSASSPTAALGSGRVRGCASSGCEFTQPSTGIWRVGPHSHCLISATEAIVVFPRRQSAIQSEMMNQRTDVSMRMEMAEFSRRRGSVAACKRPRIESGELALQNCTIK